MPLCAPTTPSETDTLSGAYAPVPPPGWSCIGFHTDLEEDEDLYGRDEQFEVLFDAPGVLLAFDGEHYRGLIRRANVTLDTSMVFWTQLRKLGLTPERYNPSPIPGVSALVLRKLTDEEKENDVHNN